MLITSNVPGPNDLQLDGMERFVSENVEDLVCKIQKAQASFTNIEERKNNVTRRYDLMHWAESVITKY